MKIGNLWFDNSKDSFVIKCNRAIKFFKDKYDINPEVVVVHPSTKIEPIEGIKIEVSRSVLPNHFWIGLE